MYKYGFVPVNSRREQDILRFADMLLNGINPRGELAPPDEATVDAGFLFRFDPVWRKQVSRIRKMMRSLVGQPGDGPLSSEDGARLSVHLYNNPNTSVGLKAVQNGQTNIRNTDAYTITTSASNGSYHCLDRQLKKARQAAIRQALHGDASELEHLRPRVWMEAKQTGEIQIELRRLARAYNLIPSESEMSDYTPNEVHLMYDSVVNYVIWEHAELSFRWPKTRLRESARRDGMERTIRPYKWPSGMYLQDRANRNWVTGAWREIESGGRIFIEDKPAQTKSPMSPAVRIRTWSIYYLTRRGGGERTEQAAVDLWNEVFNELSVSSPSNYRKQRTRLFAIGAEKTG